MGNLRRTLRVDIDATENQLDRIDERNLEQAPLPEVVDLYILTSELRGSSDDLRKSASQIIQNRMTGDRAQGSLGEVTRVEQTRWNLRDSEEVVEKMARGGIPRDRLVSVDSDRVEDEIKNANGVVKSDVFDSYSYDYVRKGSFSEEDKRQLAERCREIEDPEIENACLTRFAD